MGVAGTKTWLSIAAAMAFALPAHADQTGARDAGAERAAPMLLAQAKPAASANAANAQAVLDALIKTAKAEGEVLFYTAATENVGRRVSDAFSAKYGIKTAFIRLNSIALQQRF